jgi:pyruvate dehydrogenase E2 component (dihydrolipoamide acetyltransferase)
MSVQEFRLPDLGEGLTEGEILQWLVAVGDEVKLNQPIVEVETAKAAVEVPSPYAGIVTALLHEAGETVDVGTPIIRIDSGGGVESEQQARDAVADALVPTAVAENPPGAPEAPGSPEPPARTSVLVGYGPRHGAAVRRPRRPSGPARPVVEKDGITEPPVLGRSRESGVAVGDRARAVAQEGVLAKPPVRKLARDLGVDLTDVRGTGPGGTVTREDVQAASPGFATVGGIAPEADEDVQRIPIKGVRKHTAAAMVASAFTAPHASTYLSVDVTQLTEMRSRLAALPDFADVKVSPLLLIARALLNAVRRYPEINASWDEAAQEIVIRRRINLGIAAATPRGLIVPNIKDAGSLSLPELAVALQALTGTAREGKTSPADLSGGTITITNVGVFGVDGGTPILNPGEAAILCVGAISARPWVHDGAVAIRQVCDLSLSFDHRMIDGQLGSEFLAAIGRQLADPAVMLAWG